MLQENGQKKKKRVTCFAKLLQNDLISNVACFTTHKTNLATLFVARQLRTWVVKRATSLSQLVLQHYVAKQVERFSLARFTDLFLHMKHCLQFLLGLLKYTGEIKQSFCKV